MEIKVTKLSQEQLKQMKVSQWPIREKEVSLSCAWDIKKPVRKHCHFR